jgi:hypothetical protein
MFVDGHSVILWLLLRCNNESTSTKLSADYILRCIFLLLYKDKHGVNMIFEMSVEKCASKGFYQWRLRNSKLIALNTHFNNDNFKLYDCTNHTLLLRREFARSFILIGIVFSGNLKSETVSGSNIANQCSNTIISFHNMPEAIRETICLSNSSEVVTRDLERGLNSNKSN